MQKNSSSNKTLKVASATLEKSVSINGLLKQLSTLRAEMLNEVENNATRLAKVHPDHQASARNLLHYLVLRRSDLRPLQLGLAELGLSSLGRAEAHVLATIEAVLKAIHSLAGSVWSAPPNENALIQFHQGTELLAKHTEHLLGALPVEPRARIMVTMPSEAAYDYTLIHDLLQQGMNCMRINCAHDDTTAWQKMIEHLRRAEQALGLPCQVAMDLAGPKLRTGPLAPGVAVVRVKPNRDNFGRVVAPARLWLTDEKNVHSSPSPANICLSLPQTWLAQACKGESVSFIDARNAKRAMTFVEVSEQGCWAEMSQTAYLIPETVLYHEYKGCKKEHRAAPIGDLPPLEQAILLHEGDMLVLTRDLTPGHPATYDSAGLILTPARIGCSIPDVFNDVDIGESIWFDDGKIGGLIEKVAANEVLVRITQASMQGEKLRADKGINLPDSNLSLTALTVKDLEDLRFVAVHADIVELSFVNTAQDVEALQNHLAREEGKSLGIVLKIETQRGFANLPDILLTAMQFERCGVMIARGDLAVECGFERLAEVQEEILWISEAAHAPAIWATQVLETLVKDGMPSRSEITDAAMGHRAECVMLNKGPYILNGVRVLDDILRRMQSHHTKKRPMLRELQLAHSLPAEEVEP